MTRPAFIFALPRRGSDGTLPAALRRVPDPAVLCGDEARLWVSSGTPVVGLGRAGCLVGRAMADHRSGWNEGLPTASDTSTAAFAADLVAKVWGAYVAIIFDRDRNELAVLPDPSGLFPVYRMITATHVLVSNDARLFREAGAGAPDICWRAVGEYLSYPELRRRRTCLRGVDELSPGALAFPARDGTEATVIWQAAGFLPSGAGPCFEEAAEDLRALAVRVIGAWADLLGPVAVAASGGVDSSFICGALARSGKDFACITLATADASGDEREYARRLAAHLDVELAERIYDPDRFDPALSASAGLPRPSRKSFLAVVDALLTEGADSLAARTVFDGNAGDNLFCFLHSAAPVVDRLRVEGLRRGVLGTFLDMCRVTGCDMPAMARATAGRLLRVQDTEWAHDPRLLSDHVGHGAEVKPVVAWLDLDTGRHAGKRDHLALIMRAQLHVHGVASGRRFSPLMSQPLLEFCLRIPTWTWVTGGRNRSLARAAFRFELPPALLARTSKAGPDAFLRTAFERHRRALRELLLDGELGLQGLLDRKQVETAFRTETARQGSIVYRLLDLVETENWVRSWRD